MPILIRSNRHLFRRCEVAHPKDVTTYPDDRFSKKELKILMAEPMLEVEITKPEPEKDKKGSSGTKAAKTKKEPGGTKATKTKEDPAGTKTEG